MIKRHPDGTIRGWGKYNLNDIHTARQQGRTKRIGESPSAEIIAG